MELQEKASRTCFKMVNSVPAIINGEWNTYEIAEARNRLVEAVRAEKRN